MSLPQHGPWVREGWGLGYEARHSSPGHCYSKKQHGDVHNGALGITESFSSVGLFTVRKELQNVFFSRAMGENVETEATCCMKQLRHYACCRPATLRGRRVLAADGDLAVEPKSTSGIRCLDFSFTFTFF